MRRVRGFVACFDGASRHRGCTTGRAATRFLQGRTTVRTVCRRLLADVDAARRSLRNAPLFTAVAIVSMAFGIGANTTVFTLVDQVLLRSIPVSKPSELVQVSSVGSPLAGMGDGTELSYALYRELRD